MRMTLSPFLSRFVLSVLSAVLMWIAWPTLSVTIALFFGLVPLLFVERGIRLDDSGHKGRRLFLWSWFSFILWTLLTNWWIYNAHWSGMVAAMFVNGTLMALVWWLFHKASVLLNPLKGRIALVVFWLAFELFHLDWDLSYPWMMLGNGLSSRPVMIQFYEYTGVMGGTLWILIINLIIFSFLSSAMIVSNGSNARPRYRLLFPLFILLIVPLFFSGLSEEEINDLDRIEVAIVQPNLDPYTEKFERNNLDQVAYFDQLIPEAERADLDLIVFPETCLPDGFFLENIDHDPGIRSLMYWIELNPELKILTGASTYTVYEDEADKTATARPMNNGMWYDAFNSGIYLSNGNPPQIYHKSKLVAGVEMMPFQSVIQPLLGNVALDLGGIVGALGAMEERKVFGEKENGALAPVICYESIYGAYVTEYVRNGANLIAIITNDGWWGDTEGHRQHFHYAQIRAIETRRFIVRSANTGISAYINPNGEVIQKMGWDETGYLRDFVVLNEEKTFYSIYGNFFGRIASFMAVLFLAYMISAWRIKRGGLSMTQRFE